MKNMNEYTIYCTVEQTRKALELGAPLFRYTSIPNFAEVIEVTSCEYYEIPTTEQMYEWLIEKGIHAEIEYCLLYKHYDICILDEDKSKTMFNDDFGLPSYTSRKEAALAAIDAALDYLSKNK